jgi:hypothetical protein
VNGSGSPKGKAKSRGPGCQSILTTETNDEEEKKIVQRAWRPSILAAHREDAFRVLMWDKVYHSFANVPENVKEIDADDA